MKIILKEEPRLLRTKKYSTIDFTFIYPIKYQRKNCFYLDFISNLITNSSYDYKDENSFKKAKAKNLIIRYNTRVRRYYNELYFEINCCFPNPKIVKDFNLKEAFKFIMRSILNPNIEENAFSTKQFLRELDYFKSYYSDLNSNIDEIIYQDFLKTVNKNLYKKYSKTANLKLLDKIDHISLFNYYKENILDNSPLIYVYGNISKKDIDDLLKPYFVYQVKPRCFPKNYFDFQKPRNETISFEKKYPKQNNTLYLNYYISNMQKEELIYLMFLSDILNLPIGVEPLFNRIRIKNNLVYDIYSNINIFYGMITITTSFENSKKDLILKIIQEEIDKLQSLKNIQKYQKKVIKMLKDNVIYKKDSKYYPYDLLINKDIGIGYSEEEILNYYQNLDLIKFIDFLKRIKLDTIYYAKGEEKNENKN